MSDHTPGPWTVEPMSNVDDEEAAKPFAYVIGPDDVDPWAPPAEWRFKIADAHLIAAAPDLLAALEQIVDLDAFPDEFSFRADEIARAAIAKATGVGST